MKKNIIAISFLAAAAALSGCMTLNVDQPGSKRPEGTWNSITGTLSGVRYYNSDRDNVYRAAEEAMKEMGIAVMGYSPIRNGYTLFGRAVGDVKVTIDIVAIKPLQKSDKGFASSAPYTEVSVSYGWNSGDALRIVSKISSRLPPES